MSRTVHVDDPAVLSAIARLPPEVAYGPRDQSFLKHLLCTWRILADWRMPVAVCRAGFMHSVYSTSYYPHALFALHQRGIVRRAIGEEAEELVFRFCTMERRGFWDELASRPRARSLTYRNRLREDAAVRVSRQTLEKLLMIESANHAEQARTADFGPAPWMSRLLHWWQFLDDRAIPLGLGVRPVLTRPADEDAIHAYRAALNAPVKRAIPLLERAMQQNPWAAEPRLMRALCAVKLRDGCAALYAQEGARLLSAWAVPWDKRLTVNGWKALAERIESASGSGDSAQLDFASIRAALNKDARMPRWLLV
jgi:hypothetical protein